MKWNSRSTTLAVLTGLLNAAVVSADTCSKIAAAISTKSAVYYPGSAGYAQDISHFTPRSAQNSTCSVEPGTTEDVSKIIKIIGQDKSPFAVKSGGHAHNTGFSSTPTGVTISMSRFKKVAYNSKAGTVDIGPGQIWQDVFAILDPFNVTVLGARSGPVGVGGYSTGGGFSWKANQYGLFVDTIVSHEVVLPNGDIITASSTSNPDIFYALKGGHNNFGIVTNFKVKAYYQGAVTGGAIYYAPQYSDQVIAVTEAFMKNNKDTKAQLYTSHGWSIANNALETVVFLFYDGPVVPAGVFDPFLAIPTIDRSDYKVKTMTQMVANIGTFLQGPRWQADHYPMLNYTKPVMKKIVELATFWGQDCVKHGCTVHAILAEPFHQNLWAVSTDSAFPHGKNHALYPGFITFVWSDPAEDAYFHNAIKSIGSDILAALIADGQDLGGLKGIRYPNYAIDDETAERLFAENLPKLKTIKKKVDPNNVMGLAGGFKIKA